ncbi:hypothetical protein AUL39_07240 [Tractidigestivibacter scatoligenes]|uniref:Uncharacterized protein n=1 Tax=Tractidigestivibacter scatoligenes TaxID=1299998 RepID=A0A100YUP0_TRASO|nr:hypothetical protein [Tractidigestivibacter scatoligenes]KUH58011.1 hypothetical protein AUL39_07240 [Tractidigestivibacter scatoligenes]
MPSISTSSPLIIFIVFLIMIALLFSAVLVAAVAQAIVNKVRGQHGPQENVTTYPTMLYPRY